MDSNQRAIQAGLEPINLKSVLIGNGLTNFPVQMESYVEMQCTNASYPTVQSIAGCVRMKTVLPRCLKMLQAECVDRFDLTGCHIAEAFCQDELFRSYLDLGRNPYDIPKSCDGSIEETLCYPLSVNISNYLNLPFIRKALGVDDAVPEHVMASPDVGRRFLSLGDELHDTSLYVAGLLERGVKILIYVGDHDFICNWIGNLKWTETFEWTGHQSYIADPLRPWTVNGKDAGITRGARGLTFATVHGAGHMVPYDKPVQALELLTRWLRDGAL